MFEHVEHAVAAVRDAVSRLDVRRMAGSDAARLVELLAEGERLCAAGRTLAARRVERTGVWRTLGYRTPAQWMAARTQTTVGHAITALETGRRLDGLPGVREAYQAGRLSEVQAGEISAAAAADPSAEAVLLATAQTHNVAGLRERCREVRASASRDQDAYERIRRARYLRQWTDRDGAVRLDARLAPDDGARLIVAVQARADRISAEARDSGRREPAEAYAADALVSLADGRGAGPRALVHIHVDHAAFTRGYVVEGETCRIAGVGPIPVSVARRLAGDAILRTIVSDGVDVQAVAHPGRTIPAHVRTALEARDPTCVVPGCGTRHGLEIDHIIPFAEGGPTRLENLARLCRWHHAQKTHHGWRLGGSPGAWTWAKARARTTPAAAGNLPPPG